MEEMWRKVSGSLWGLWHLEPAPDVRDPAPVREATSLSSLAVHSTNIKNLPDPGIMDRRQCISSENIHRVNALHPTVSAVAVLPSAPNSTSHSASKKNKRTVRSILHFHKPNRNSSKSAEKLGGLYTNPAIAAPEWRLVGKEEELVDLCNNLASVQTLDEDQQNGNIMASSWHPSLEMGTSTSSSGSQSPAGKKLAAWTASVRRRLSLSSTASSSQQQLNTLPRKNHQLPPAPSKGQRLNRPASVHMDKAHSTRLGFHPSQQPFLLNKNGKSKYQRLAKIGEGSYATVYKCRNTMTGGYVALKEIKLQPDEGVPFTAIREASLLKALRHANIVPLFEIIHEKECLTLVFEHMDGDLSKFLEPYPNGLLVANCKLILFQLSRGLAYCHERKILHRDLKPQNILINASGEVKLADFGLARAASVPSRTYSHEVVTLWYRPPDILLGSTNYSTSLDIWGLGCIFAELLTGAALFPGTKDVRDQVDRIFALLGTPYPDMWPGLEQLNGFRSHRWAVHSPQPISSISRKLGGEWSSASGLLRLMLQLRPVGRISAKGALTHSFFADLPPLIHRLPQQASIFSLPRVALVPEPPTHFAPYSNPNDDVEPL